MSTRLMRRVNSSLPCLNAAVTPASRASIVSALAAVASRLPAKKIQKCSRGDGLGGAHSHMGAVGVEPRATATPFVVVSAGRCFSPSNRWEDTAEEGTSRSAAFVGSSPSPNTKPVEPTERPPPPPPAVILRGFPASWGTAEIHSFVTDALGPDAHTYVAATAEEEGGAHLFEGDERAKGERSSRDVDIGDSGGGGVDFIDDLLREASSAGGAASGSHHSGSEEEASRYRSAAHAGPRHGGEWVKVSVIDKVKMRYAAKKGTTLCTAVVYFRPMRRPDGTLRAERLKGGIPGAHARAASGGSAPYHREQHPAVTVLLNTDPIAVVPALKQREEHRRRAGRRLFTIAVFDPAAANLARSGGRSTLSDEGRILYEARHVPEVLATLDIDRLLMSPDLLYDFARLRQPKYVPMGTLRKQQQHPVHLPSFRPTAADQALDGRDPSAPSEDASFVESGDESVAIVAQFGRGSPVNASNGASSPYLPKSVSSGTQTRR